MNVRRYVTSRKFLWAASVVAILFFAVGLLSGDAGKSLFISDKGYVGLNTQEPKSLLDVNGDIRAGNSTLFFTQTAHYWNAVGDPVSWALSRTLVIYMPLLSQGEMRAAWQHRSGS